VAKSQEDRDRPFEEDKWQRSRDLVNSEVRKVRAQELGAPSHEWRSHEITRSVDSRWIQVTGGPLDQEPHRLSCIWGFERLKGVVFDFMSSEVSRAGHERTRGRTTRWGPRGG
jgi:hypothetical protein